MIDAKFIFAVLGPALLILQTATDLRVKSCIENLNHLRYSDVPSPTP